MTGNPPGMAALEILMQGPTLEVAVETLLSADYRVSQNADRMGFRLDGPTLAHRDGYNIVSDGIAAGALQVPRSTART